MPLIQDIFKQYGEAYIQKYAHRIPASHKKTLQAIISCRTKSLGGEVYYCNQCSQFHYSYHSCQNRHCVVCQNNDAGDWVDKNKKMMLPVPYFLATFTMPAELRILARKNQKLFYSILFNASSKAIKLLSKDEKYLGADIGMIGILHTWTRALFYHPHVHYLIPAAGLDSSGTKMRFSDDEFLVHVKPLSILFKAKFRDALKEKEPDIFNKIHPDCWTRKWVVHIKPVGNGDKALEYMGRYLFRVAISNNRILKLSNGKVTFRYTDNKTGQNKIVTVDAFEFIRRFLQHVLPHKFIKVRYYGFYAAAAKKKLSKIRQLLFLDSMPVENTPADKPTKTLVCPICGNPLVWIQTLPRGPDNHVP